jgi:hypothetical protein
MNTQWCKFEQGYPPLCQVMLKSPVKNKMNQRGFVWFVVCV